MRGRIVDRTGWYDGPMSAGSNGVALDMGGGIFVVPVLHERLESADAVRRALARLSPDAVAVEVPSSLSRIFARAIDRPWACRTLYRLAAPLAAICLCWGCGEWLGLWAGAGRSAAELR